MPTIAKRDVTRKNPANSFVPILTFPSFMATPSFYPLCSTFPPPGCSLPKNSSLISKPPCHPRKDGRIRLRIVDSRFDADIDIQVFGDAVDDARKREGGLSVYRPVGAPLLPDVRNDPDGVLDAVLHSEGEMAEVLPLVMPVVVPEVTEVQMECPGIHRLRGDNVRAVAVFSRAEPFPVIAGGERDPRFQSEAQPAVFVKSPLHLDGRVGGPLFTCMGETRRGRVGFRGLDPQVGNAEDGVNSLCQAIGKRDSRLNSPLDGFHAQSGFPVGPLLAVHLELGPSRALRSGVVGDERMGRVVRSRHQHHPPKNKRTKRYEARLGLVADIQYNRFPSHHLSRPFILTGT